MESLVQLQVVVEGATDVPVVRKVLSLTNCEASVVHVTNGKGPLDKRLKAYNHAAQFTPWLVLRDLDRDAPCPIELLQKLLPGPAPQMCFRLAVRSLEAWLLADRERVSEALKVRIERIPTAPDTLVNPKLELTNLARQSSSSRIKSALVPKPGTGTAVGPGFESWAIQYATEQWRPEIARAISPSLDRCIRGIERMAEGLRAQS